MVLDRGDDVRFTRAALASHDPGAGRVVVHPTVTSSGRLLWHDMLQALGCGPRHAAAGCAHPGKSSGAQSAPLCRARRAAR